jgi:hypothetical protein
MQHRKAHREIRETIIECLLTPGRCFLGEHPTRAWLNKWEISDKGLYEEPAEALQRYELFFKPHTNPQKFQFVLRSFDTEETSILIHITLSPRGDPPKVKINAHPHDIPTSPLPLIKVAP